LKSSGEGGDDSYATLDEGDKGIVRAEVKIVGRNRAPKGWQPKSRDIFTTDRKLASSIHTLKAAKRMKNISTGKNHEVAIQNKLMC
jgi:hypothetical protein